MHIKSKICGVSDSKTLDYIINHNYPPQFIGFIVNYKKSKRFVEFEKLKIMLDCKKKKSFFVAVLVKPDNEILEKIKNINFDYYQIYDSSPKELEFIKKKYKKKIITAIAISNEHDVEKYKDYMDVTDIYLFDSKGYEQSLSFNHKFLKNINTDQDIMIAGNINISDKLENLKEIADIIDISGGLETSDLKDISKIDIFLRKINKINEENY